MRFDNLKSIKNMLRKGASRSLLDLNNQRAIDLIDPNCNQYQMKELETILDKEPIDNPCC